MSVLPASRGLTPEEADLLPDAEAYELDGGELKEREMSPDSVWIGGEVFGELRMYAKEHGGLAFADGLSLKLWPDSQRKLVRPDACYFAAGALEDDVVPSKGVVATAPTVVVEVISPGEKGQDIAQKTQDYLEAGVRAVWTVYPNTRAVFVHRLGRDVQFFPSGATLQGEPELPGFSVGVLTLFPPPASA